MTEEIILTWLDENHPINNILNYENYFINLVDFNIISKSIDLSLDFIIEYKKRVNYKRINQYNKNIVSLKDYLNSNDNLFKDFITYNNKINYEDKLNHFNITPKIIMKDDLYILDNVFYYKNSKFNNKTEAINYFRKMWRVKKKKQQIYFDNIELINNLYYN